MLALAGARLATMGRRLQVVTVVAGLATILVAATRFDEQTPFPGFWAGVPVLGTAMVLLGGMHGAASLPSRLLGTSVPVFIGRLSYSWYLWHWPFLIMSARLLGPLSVPENLGVVTLALGAAAISYALVEAPLRRNALLRNPQWAISCGVLSVGVLVSLGMAINFAADRRMADPYLAALVAARDGRSESGPPESCSMAVIADEEYCVHGPTNASRLVLLVGDSHAAQWSPAVIEAAASSDARGTRTNGYGGCPATDLPVRATGKAGVSDARARFRAETQCLISETRSNLVVMSNADHVGRLINPDSDALLSEANAVDTLDRTGRPLRRRAPRARSTPRGHCEQSGPVRRTRSSVSPGIAMPSGAQSRRVRYWPDRPS